MLFRSFNVIRLLSLILPPPVLYAVFYLIGCTLYYSRAGMRRDLLEKISDAMPEVTDDHTIASIGREACVSATLPMLDLLIFGRHRDLYMNRLRIEGWENLERAEAEGKGVILVFAHIGAYGTSPVVMARLRKPFVPIMFSPQDTPVPRSSRAVDEYGKSLGGDPEGPIFWAGDDTRSRVREHLGKGKRVGIALDVDGPCVVDFFGRPAALADGIAQFALDMGAPLVPFRLLRGKSIMDHELRIYEPITYEKSGERKEDTRSLMQQVAGSGEKQIREAPGQWMNWFGLWHWWGKAGELEGCGK